MASNGVGVNISRAIGPALGGVVIGGLGIARPFWISWAAPEKLRALDRLTDADWTAASMVTLIRPESAWSWARERPADEPPLSQAETATSAYWNQFCCPGLTFEPSKPLK